MSKFMLLSFVALLLFATLSATAQRKPTVKEFHTPDLGAGQEVRHKFSLGKDPKVKKVTITRICELPLIEMGYDCGGCGDTHRISDDYDSVYIDDPKGTEYIIVVRNKAVRKVAVTIKVTIEY